MSDSKPFTSQDVLTSNSTVKGVTESAVEMSEEVEAVLLMKERLPSYVVESFIVSGYDTLKVISEMESDDLLEIEQHISNECKCDSRFDAGFSVSGIFKFLPGHRKRIMKFVTENRACGHPVTLKVISQYWNRIF